MAYQRGEMPKDGERARYSEHLIIEPDDAGKVRVAMIHSAGRLQNVIAGIAGVIDLLAKMQVHPEEEVKLREACDVIREVAFAIEPRRGNERS